MADENDILARHEERRRAFLAKTATTSPVVGLLLAQSARPARAATYSGSGNTTTVPETTSLSTSITSQTPPGTTTIPFTTLFTGTIPTTSSPTTLVTFPLTTL